MAKEEVIQSTEINHPGYYNRYTVEAVDMARKIWGDAAIIQAAEITAFFYRMRAGVKEGVAFEQDLAKEQWWLNYKHSVLDDDGQ